MEMLKSDGRMEGWLYLIRSNRFGLQYTRKRYFILEENCLKSFKSKPTSDSQKPLRSAIVDSFIRVTDNGRESFSRKVFFIFTLYNTSNHSDCLKLGASNPEEAARWIHSLQDVAMEPGTNSKRRWQPFRLNDSKSGARKRSVDWTSSASMNVDAMTSDVIAPSQWKIFGCKNGLRLFKEARDNNNNSSTSSDYPAIMAVGVIEGTCEAVFRTFMSLGVSRSEWDFCFYNGSVVEHLDGHTDIVHIQLCRDWLPWGMSRRDLLLRRYWRREDDGTYVILCHSVIHSKCPPQQNYVRAWLQSGGFVVSPLNQGKECVVKHMLSIDWKVWRSYLPKTPARSMTIRMLGRVSALKELFRAKGGDQFPSEFLTGEVESLQTGDEQTKQEADLMQFEDEKMEDANDASVSCSSSLIGLNDTSDEFYDFPEPSENKKDKTTLDEEEEESLLVCLLITDLIFFQNLFFQSLNLAFLFMQPKQLSTAASFVKKLHSLTSQKKGYLDSLDVEWDSTLPHCYGSTLLKDLSCNAPCTWAASDPSLFLVRGPNYHKDNQKNKAKGTMMEMVAADWLQSDKREDDLAGRSGGIVQKYASQGGPEFFFVINIQVPGATTYNLVLYYMTRTPLEESPLLERFVNGDDTFRNSRFKLIPYISKGSWLVKQSVGKKACLVGQALEVTYFRGANYLELDIDVGSSTVARGVVNLVLGYLNNLIVEMAFLIQANTQDELPECLLGTCRLNHMDTDKSVSVDSINK
uniref:protein ENHANCED DISEASE RESISTANCE 2-like n=1 Tax=Erigeron canadensis TaxID=72917 RepID=UPI001CB9130D|nr:protein ENHANCED DISEASE RESISTANCE 2-like [Erigeron canadensis]